MGPKEPETEAKSKRGKTPDKEQELLAKRELVLESAAGGRLDTIQERVAWVLNHFPETRDSDITLQLKYWEYFDDIYDGYSIEPQDLYKLTRLTSLKRARAMIQNTLKLFQASPEVRKFRGKLDEEEREKVITQRPAHPVFAVFADESGKTTDYLIVGSLWLLHGYETYRLTQEIKEWRKANSFQEEFHLKKIGWSTLRSYKEIADLLVRNSSVVSFKAISVERAGTKHVQESLSKLYYHLLLRGVEHENETGRAPLPRSIQVWKDAEEAGADKLFLANLEDKLKQAAKTRFDEKLYVDHLEAVDSKKLDLVQLADLFTGSLNRVLNASGQRVGPKDQFADYFLGILGMPDGYTTEESLGDMTVHISL